MPKTCAKLSNRKATEQKKEGQNYNRQLLRRPRPKAEKGPAVLKTACPRTNILVEIMSNIFADQINKTCRNPCPACTCGKTEQSGSQRAGLYAGGILVFRLPKPLPIEIIKLKLRTKVDSYSSSRDNCWDLQTVEVTTSSPTCIKPNVVRSLYCPPTENERT